MPLSAIDPAALASLTPQQLADLALSADREARAALRRDEVHAALAHASERDELAALFVRK